MLKGATPIIIALVLALGAGALAWMQINNYKTEVTRNWKLQHVIVASEDIQPGTALSTDYVSKGEMPQKFVYESVLVPGDMDVAMGREVLVPIKRGEPVHWYQLQGVRSLERLSKAIRPKGRAVSIDVNERSSVGQWVRPNDHVDILGIFRDPSTNEMIAVTLMENVIVLATGNNTAATRKNSDQKYNTVTVFVVPEEAEALVLAQELGSLYLSLRNATDVSAFESRARTTIKTLITGERMKKIGRKRENIIKIIRGLEKNKIGQ